MTACKSFRSVLVGNPSVTGSLSRVLPERRADRVAQSERLDAATREKRRRCESGKLRHNVDQFFGVFE